MAKLGTEKHPAIVRVQTQQRATEIAAICNQHGWIYIIGIEPEKPEDITDVERLLHPTRPIVADKMPGRNDPCPCGSGKKYKQCHGARQ